MIQLHRRCCGDRLDNLLRYTILFWVSRKWWGSERIKFASQRQAAVFWNIAKMLFPDEGGDSIRRAEVAMESLLYREEMLQKAYRRTFLSIHAERILEESSSSDDEIAGVLLNRLREQGKIK